MDVTGVAETFARCDHGIGGGVFFVETHVASGCIAMDRRRRMGGFVVGIVATGGGGALLAAGGIVRIFYLFWDE